MVRNFILLLSLFSITLFGQDNDNPILNGVTFSPSTVKAGEILTVTFNISDASALKYIAADLGSFDLGSRNDLKDFTISGNNYSTEVVVPSWHKVGDYSLSGISIKDIYNNGIFTSNNSEVSITNDNPDNLAPVLVSMTTDKAQYMGGEEIILTAKITEEASGLKPFTGSFSTKKLDSDIDFGNFSNYKHRVLSNGNIEMHIRVSPFIKTGLYSLSSLSLRDEAGNSNFISDFDLKFTVTGTVLDNTDPEITNITFSPSIINAGQSFEITVSATDDISGIDFLNVTLENQSNNSIDAEGLAGPTWTKDGNDYTFTYQTNQYISGGTYTVDRTTISDSANNRDTDFNPSYANTITINSTQEDVTAPVLNSYTVDKNTVSAGSTFNFTFEATDDVSGLGSIWVGFSTKSIQLPRGLGLSPSFSVELNIDEITSLGGDNYSAALTVDEYLPEGTYEINVVRLYDLAGNYSTIYSSADATTNITVTNPNPDLTAPQVTSAEFSTKQVLKGDTATLVLKINDDSFNGTIILEINQDQFYAKPPRTRFSYGTEYNFFTETDKNTWEYKIETYKLKSGVWSLGNIYLIDGVGNYYDGTPYNNVTFEVVDELAKESTDLTNSIRNTPKDDILKVFPNPASSSFQVNLSSVDIIEIYNLEGNLKKSFIEAKSYDISTLEQGIYVLKIQSNNISYTKKMIIE